jgi:hypothetical protein
MRAEPIRSPRHDELHWRLAVDGERVALGLDPGSGARYSRLPRPEPIDDILRADLVVIDELGFFRP